MASGGARSRSGPAPDPNALRRSRKDDAGWITLPAEGRTTPAPEWPLEGQSDREAELWERFWRKPVALIWERDQQEEHVALFVRMFAEGEQERARSEDRKTVKQMFADLYLTSDSMLKARLRIGAVAEPEQDETPVTPVVRRSSTRDRLRVVNDGGS